MFVPGHEPDDWQPQSSRRSRSHSCTYRQTDGRNDRGAMLSPTTFSPDYVPTSSGPFRPGERDRGNRPSDVARAMGTGSDGYAQPPIYGVPYQQHGDPHHHHHDDSSRRRSSSHSDPYRYSSSARPTYSRRRSSSYDDRDPRMSRSRPTANYRVQNQPLGYGTGYGASGQSQFPAQMQPQMQTQQQVPNNMYPSNTGNNYGMGQQSPTAPTIIQAPPNQSIVVPLNDGTGGYVVVPPHGQNVRVMQNPATAPYPSTANTRSRGHPSNPGFFSGLMGFGNRSRSLAPEIHPRAHQAQLAQPAQYSIPRPRRSRRRSYSR
ncbi:hypothetical protein BDZ97DRAFT_1824954 [Flammula alnicola]|nr:hypothetical protein BDZ97DRAFT_1824954 [Flammula alnicola]